MDKKCLTFALMDPPFESARTATAFRLLHAALGADTTSTSSHTRARWDSPFARQRRMPTPRTDATPSKKRIRCRACGSSGCRRRRAARRGLEWVNCGLCVDERGVAEAIGGVKRGSPADLWRRAQAADNTLVIATR